MLNKQHNSVITLAAVLLALVGTPKPAKAFLLTQANPSSTNFSVPDTLPNKAKVQVATSSSVSSINQGLIDSFSQKYPKAKVNLTTQTSQEALQALSEGKVDVVGIGRNLTAAEKQKGLVAVPISREKIAIVISKDNPYDGNLTISQFAKIFRGEITDWSELGGNPGKINLVDLPDTNDTRQAFPNYPVFQEAEFKTGNNSTKLTQDDTDELVGKLGANGIGYTVANDAIARDDVKIVTMHQTQPDDQRYPFSQPFYLVHQGNPSEATKAFLGFATSEAGEKVIASRVGSISTAAAIAIASQVGNNKANNTAVLPKTDPNTAKTTDAGTDSPAGNKVAGTDAGTDSPAGNKVAGTNAGTDSLAGNKVAGTDAGTDSPAGDKIAGTDAGTDSPAGDKVAGANAGTDSPAGDKIAGTDAGTDSPTGNTNSPAGDKVAGANAGTAGTADTELQDSGEVNPDVEGSGEVNPDLQDSGKIEPGVEGSGEVNPDLQDSGKIEPGVEGSGEVNPDLQDSGQPNAAIDGDNMMIIR